MATIKSFTDIPQSKTLAEFLSLESADNIIVSIGDRDGVKTITMPKETFNILRTPFTDIRNTIPCWSLAALLDILPLEIDTHKQTDGHKIYYYVESYMKRNGKEMYLSTERHENLVDACYKMILELKENNLI